MSISYAYEKLWLAVESLATGTDPLQKRLQHAWFATVGVLPDQIPEDYRSEWLDIQEALTKEPAKGHEGNIAATTAAMDDETATKVAGRIFSLFRKVAAADALQNPDMYN